MKIIPKIVVKFTDWSPWTSPCSTTCGPGEIVRSRECVVEGMCKLEELRDIQSCSLKNCSTSDFLFFLFFSSYNFLAIVGEWSGWGGCSHKCGFKGIQRNVRECVAGDCIGFSLNKSRNCGGISTSPCRKLDFVTFLSKTRGFILVGPWQSWGDCFPLCGNSSFSTRNRTCVGPMCHLETVTNSSKCRDTVCGNK